MGLKFEMGRLMATPGALERVPGDQILLAISRHGKGDWGQICAEDWELNNKALEHGTRLLSAYTTTDGTKFWIITEADRSVTTVLLPEEY